MIDRSARFLHQCGNWVQKHRRVSVLLPILAIAAILVTWQIAFAQAPTPNPLAPVDAGGNPIFAPVPGADITRNGEAASMHGDPARGRVLFAQNCVTCHGDRGTDGIPNPGSDDGSVPLLNPIDPGFVEDAQQTKDVVGNFARGIDLFIQHGSRPEGDNPLYSMIGWGDHKLMNQQQIADVEAYIMQLNGIYWTDRYASPGEVRMTAASDGKFVTYTIWLVNHGSSPLDDITLQDTFPAGLIPVKAAIIGFDEGNDGTIEGNNVSFVGTPNVPQGGMLGPFLILTRIADPSKPVPADTAELFFTFQTFDGNMVTANALSDAIVPSTQKTGAAPATAATPAATRTPSATPAGSATATTTKAATAGATPAPTNAGATPAPSSTPAAIPTSAASPTPAAANPPTSSGAVKIVEPNPGALSWGFDPPSITVKVGDKVTWTNAGSLQHTATADDGTFDSGLLNTNDSWGFTFTKAGTYTYHCAPHPWMKGTIVVQ